MSPRPRPGFPSLIAAPMLAAALLMPAAAFGQPNPVNPYTYTCADLLAAAEQGPGHSDTTLANLMILWTAGYFYGRLGSLEGSTFTDENFDLVRDDTVAALTGICPNVPHMPIATFAENLANDFERSLTGE